MRQLRSTHRLHTAGSDVGGLRSRKLYIVAGKISGPQRTLWGSRTPRRPSEPDVKRAETLVTVPQALELDTAQVNWAPGLHAAHTKAVDTSAYGQSSGRWSRLFLPAVLAAVEVTTGHSTRDRAMGGF